MTSRHPIGTISKTARASRTARRRAKTVPARHPLTHVEVARIATAYWAPWEVAAIARAWLSTPADRTRRLTELRAQITAGMRGGAGDGWQWSTRGGRVEVKVRASRAAGQVRRAGTITVTTLIGHVLDRLTHDRAYAVIDATAAHRACLLAAIDAQDRHRDAEDDGQGEDVNEVEGPSWEEQSRLHRAARDAAEAILHAGLDAQLDLLDLLGAGTEATR
ncbi:hypothetical protein [Kineosporia sp. R_H_3]|uniref:hypothetical protein n=1 Tax=Kineosporia sp. R_H_3 TaxID=1961848 RepID=UPI000B4AD1D9|nr:hypothetical protein [Kineosporia sp. R_H_3]